MHMKEHLPNVTSLLIHTYIPSSLFLSISLPSLTPSILPSPSPLSLFPSPLPLPIPVSLLSAVAQKHAMESSEACASMTALFLFQLKESSTLSSPGSDWPKMLCGTVVVVLEIIAQVNVPLST